MNIFLIDTVDGQMALADIHSDTGWLRGIRLSRCQMPECGVVLDNGRHFSRARRCAIAFQDVASGSFGIKGTRWVKQEDEGKFTVGFGSFQRQEEERRIAVDVETCA